MRSITPQNTSIIYLQPHPLKYKTRQADLAVINDLQLPKKKKKKKEKKF